MIRVIRPLVSYHYNAEPTAEGCDDCGVAERGHAQMWTPTAGWHRYIPPGEDLLLMRIRDRLHRAATGRPLYDVPLLRMGLEKLEGKP